MCDICGKTVSKDEYNKHMKRHVRKELVKKQEDTSHLFHYCDQCGKKCSTRKYLNWHIKSEHENKSVRKCPECPMTFKTDRQKYCHRIVAHSHKYKCKHCGLCCVSSSKLKLHNRVHADPQFQCRHCDKKLKSEVALLAHERMHTGEKPFSCKICSASFTVLNALNQHTKGVHKIAGINGGKVGWPRKDK